LGGGKATCGPFLLTAGLGFTGFFFPLFQPMLRMSGQPAIRQQRFQGSRVAWGDGRNPTQQVRQVRPYVNAVPPELLHQQASNGVRRAEQNRPIYAVQLFRSPPPY
jgi:hypothetical protein